MELLKCFFKKIMRHLSSEYAHPCFFVDEMREALRKKEQICCEVIDVIRKNQLLK